MNSNQEVSDAIELEPSKSLFQRLGIKWSWIHHKTCHCKHRHGCIENILVHTVKCFLYAFCAKSAINTLLYLSKLAKNKISIKELLGIFFNKENLQLTGFISTLTFVLKTFICLSRRIGNKDDWKTPTFDGCLAGFEYILYIT